MDIPISILLLLCLIFLVIGAVIMLLLQYYLYLRFSNLPEESDEQKHINAKYSLPLGIKQTARALNAAATTTMTATSHAAVAAVGGATTMPSTAHSSVSTASSTHTINSGVSTTSTMSTAAAAAALAASALAHAGNATSEPTALISLNFVMQFLFHELKNSSRVRKWVYRKLSLELDELIAKTTTGKLFDKLTIKELGLGDQFPEIKTLRVHHVELNDTEGRIENLDLLLEIHYAGNFCTTIDADMVLGKKGSLTLKVKQLSGMARLQFTRQPYTHWSLSFLGDPDLDLAIESRYQGRQMQSNITSLISNQIRKAVRRKHTLPNYKLRYKPFFHKTPEEDLGDSDIQVNGQLEVKVAELSRLMCPLTITDVYCTLTLASLPFVEARQKDDRHVIVSLDVEIHKAKNQQIGIVFKQNAEQHCIEIEAVLPNTPACKSNLRSGDIVHAIEGKRIGSIQQVVKVVKSLQNTVFSLRIERVIPGIIRNDAILEDLELYEDLGDLRLNYTSNATLKPTGTLDTTDPGVKQLMARNSSAERATSSESSLNNTPTSSPKKTKLIAKALKKTITRESSETRDDESKSAKVAANVRKTLSIRPSRATGNDVEHYQQHSTIDCALSTLIHMDDLSYFKLNAQSRYLNVCVYGKAHGDTILLGFVNVSMNQVLTECCETSLSQCLKVYELNPPITQDVKAHNLSQQSGFNRNLCFGDILVAFTWDGNPNLVNTEMPAKQKGKLKTKLNSHTNEADSNTTDGGAEKPNTNSDAATITRAHNFIRTHFQRATQCDFCGKKIWLKDAVQCHECLMCCHKKCITKCQNATVCGPVDCSAALQQSGFPRPTTPSNTTTPEFTVTQADNLEPVEAEEALAMNAAANNVNASYGSNASGAEEDAKLQTPTLPIAGNDVHRSSLTGLLAQGIKRVNSANNLAIPGIVSTLTGGGGGGVSSTGSRTGNIAGGVATNTKSLPPSPQHTPSRKPSLVMNMSNPFELVTLNLETLPPDIECLSAEQIESITEPILGISKNEDVMTLAKTASKNLYADTVPKARVEKINALLSKLRLALDSETAMHATLTATTPDAATTAATSQLQKKPLTSASSSSLVSQVNAARSEDRIQALSVVMLYLCTGLQNAQGIAFH